MDQELAKDSLDSVREIRSDEGRLVGYELASVDGRKERHGESLEPSR